MVRILRRVEYKEDNCLAISDKDESGLLWPLPLQSFIEKYCYMNHGEMSEDSSQEAVVLHNAVKGFEMAVENCEELAEKEMHVLFKRVICR